MKAFFEFVNTGKAVFPKQWSFYGREFPLDRDGIEGHDELWTLCRTLAADMARMAHTGDERLIEGYKRFGILENRHGELGRVQWYEFVRLVDGFFFGYQTDLQKHWTSGWRCVKQCDNAECGKFFFQRDDRQCYCCLKCRPSKQPERLSVAAKRHRVSKSRNL